MALFGIFGTKPKENTEIIPVLTETVQGEESAQENSSEDKKKKISL